MDTGMDKKANRLTVRDDITAAILLILMFVIFFVVGTPIGMTVIGNIFVLAVCGLLFGTIYLTLLSRVNKKGVVLLFGTLLALLLLTGFWGVSVVVEIGAVIAELIWSKSNRRKHSVMTLVFTVQMVFWYLGMMLPLIFMTDLYLGAVSSYAQLYAGVLELVKGPFFFAGLAATIAGSIAGAYIGKLILKKHLIKAGIA